MAGLVEVQSKNLYPHTKLTPTQLLIMDFGILLQAISAVVVIILCCVFLLGWIFFVMDMIQNQVLSVIITLLPLVVFLIILFYHTIASS